MEQKLSQNNAREPQKIHPETFVLAKQFCDSMSIVAPQLVNNEEYVTEFINRVLQIGYEKAKKEIDNK